MSDLTSITLIFFMINQEILILKVKLRRFNTKLVLQYGAIQGTSRKRLHSKLGLMSLGKKCWYNKPTFFYEIVNGLLPDYLHSCIFIIFSCIFITFISQNNYPFSSVSYSKLNSIKSKTKSFSKTLFPYCIDEWNKHNPEIIKIYIWI